MTIAFDGSRQNRHTNANVCHHFYFHKITCDEYDALRERANGRCEICETPEQETRRQRLCIDHDGRTGMGHLIRGLICDRCNTVMACVDGNKAWGRNRKWEASARAYLANSWHQPDIVQRRLIESYERRSRNGARIGRPNPQPAALFYQELRAACEEIEALKQQNQLLAKVIGTDPCNRMAVGGGGDDA